ncbi:MAG: 2-amino-4-hydroxy-6-hydroxymethyldihydropteridine diphosphokinase [Bacteroidales bacterium]|nr:2-amino-4-hydroxy-6-hydroxymethyldihydropteridine diphosphokinase [Bacteroidales bacterium]
MSRKVDLYLGLGSNMGERELLLMRAVTLLDQALGSPAERISRIIETPSWGFEGAPFLNMCVRYSLEALEDPEAQALDVLAKVKEIENTLGRPQEPLFNDKGERIYHDRPIDIDLLFMGRLEMESETLTLPHPRIAERDFVKKPLKEIAKPSLKQAFPEIFA